MSYNYTRHSGDLTDCFKETVTGTSGGRSFGLGIRARARGRSFGLESSFGVAASFTFFILVISGIGFAFFFFFVLGLFIFCSSCRYEWEIRNEGVQVSTLGEEVR